MGKKGVINSTIAEQGKFKKINGEGKCRNGICGKEAACEELHNPTRYRCVCPHDNSDPTPSLTCPIRKLAPRNMKTGPIPVDPFPNLNHTSKVNFPETNENSIYVTTSTSVFTDQNAQNQTMSMTEMTPTLQVITTLVSTLFFISLVFIIWKILKIRKARHVKNENYNFESEQKMFVQTRYAENPEYSEMIEIDLLERSQGKWAVPLINKSDLSLIRELGEGNFGKVYKGKIISTNQEVAIKILKKSATKEAEEDFMREIEIMSNFRHANILTILGVVLPEDIKAPWMVFEYMIHGDLAEVLRANSRLFKKSFIQGMPSLANEDLYSIALQIASGMTYLSTQHFVHRDLACRNCLVTEGLIIKIADFGMSRDVYTCDYYKIGGSRMLPVRWMSPESVLYGKFTLESDVWAYGVVLWEIFTFGKQPYYGHNNEEVVKLVLDGRQLKIPNDCPPVISKLMKMCWRPEPRDRIKFSQVYEILKTETELTTSNLKENLPLPPIVETINTHLPLPPNDINFYGIKQETNTDLEHYLVPKSGPIPKIPPVYFEPI